MKTTSWYLKPARCEKCGATLVVRKIPGVSARLSRMMAVVDHHKTLHEQTARLDRGQDTIIPGFSS